MEAHARAPDPLTNVGNMANNWRSWKEDFIIFMKVTGYIDKPNEVCANLLKNRIGNIGTDAIRNISFDNPRDEDNMDILIAKLDELFDPPRNEVVERYNFFTRSKKQNESFEQYIYDLKEKAKTCNFKEMTNGIIRDKIILDTHDKILRKKFFEADNLDLQKIVIIYNDYKINTEKMFAKENKTESGNVTQRPMAYIKRGNCWRCGHQHPIGKCPAWGSKCTRCGDTNHFTQCCKSPKPNTNNNKANTNVMPFQPCKKLISKSNDKLWTDEANSTEETIASMNKMTSLPDIPTVLCDTGSSASGNDTIYDFILIDACNASSKSSYNNTISQSANLHKDTQYSYSNANGNKAEWVTDLHKKDETSQSKTSFSNTYQQPKDNSKNAPRYRKMPFNIKKRNKKADEELCVLS